MKPTYYPLAIGLFVALVAGVLLTILLGLRQALNLTHPTRTVRRPLLLAAAGLLAWLALTAGLAAAGVLDFAHRPPRLLLLLPLPLLGAGLLARSAAVGRLLDALPPASLLYPQAMRIGVELVLWLLWRAGELPRPMTFEGLNWDVLTGLTAPLVAYYCFGRGRWAWRVAVAWNFLGLALLLNIVTIAMLSTPLPFRQFMDAPANTIITRFPLVWLPLFVVPVAYTLHALSLRQLWRRAAAARAGQPAEQAVA